MRAFALCAALAALLAVAACGGTSARRHAVSAYIEKVNGIQKEMQRPLLSVTYTYRTYGRRGTPLTKSVPGLQAAVHTLAGLRVRIAELEPPPDAQALHSHLLLFAARETAFAREVLGFAEYVPAFRLTMKPLAAVNASFRRALASAKGPTRQAAVLERYRSALEPVLARLQRLHPPPILLPLHRSQLASLLGVHRAATSLARALRRQDKTDVGSLLRSFETASQSASTVRAQRAQIAAVRSYNRRLFEIRSIASRIEHDRVVLNDRLG